MKFLNRSCVLFMAFALPALTGCGGGPTSSNNGGESNGSGAPTVTVLASGLKSPYNLVVDSSNVYWVDFSDGSVWSVPTAGNVSATQLVGPDANGNSGFDIAQDSVNLYYTLYQFSVNSVPKVGGPSTDLADTNVTTYPGCSGFLCGIQPVGVITNSFSGGIFFGDTQGVLKVGSGQTATWVYNLGSIGPGYIVAANSTGIVFSFWGAPGSSIQEVPFVGGNAPTLASGQDTVFGIVAPTSGAGSGSLFWTEAGSSNDVKQLPPGGAATVLATGLSSSSNGKLLAVDNSNVYFPQGNQIAKVPIGGGTVTIDVNVSDSDGIAAIALSTSASDDCVYWASTGSGTGQGSIRKACPR